VLPAPRTQGLPRFEPSPDCTGDTQRCGFVVVPERHAHPEGRTIRLPVQVTARANRDAPPDPVIYIQGGPGAKIGPNARLQAGSATINHDVIFYEQRGVGKSEPSLDCPERDRQRLTDAVAAIEPAVRAEHLRLAGVACAERLAGEGIDVAAYNTVESAADLEDIRVALSYDHLNLVSISYGTFLAQATMRAYPQRIRSVVLDSVVPMELSAVAISPSANTDHALERTFELCAANPSCDLNFPDQSATFRRVINKLGQQPLSVPLGAQYGQAVPMTVARFVLIIFRELYFGPSNVPSLIAAADRGNGQAFADRLLSMLLFNRGYSEGMELSAICHTVGTALPDRAHVTGNGVMTSLPWASVSWVDTCQSWPHEPLDPAFRTPVHSDIPTLIIAGELDPVTAPVNARKVGQDLTHSTYVEIPRAGHGPGVNSSCGRTIIAAFLDRPDRPPDTQCLNGPPASFTLR
jgi:pimeloyl-ACP methyl ester carboxylesterase